NTQTILKMKTKTLNLNLIAFVFFFSSRRRHTRWPRDWNSDVCSSDLAIFANRDTSSYPSIATIVVMAPTTPTITTHITLEGSQRSEERRVGKECRSRWRTKKKNKKERMKEETTV